jgi:hypothetical protein
MSGLRFVRRAAALGIPVAIVNQGETRGDPLADLKVEAPLGEVLTALGTDIGILTGGGLVASASDSRSNPELQELA